MTNLKAISLFSGMGGDTLGLHNAGVKVVAYTECNKTYRETHKFNFPDCKCIGLDVGSDIRKITEEHLSEYVNNIDIIFAGFPCQGFSNAGKKKDNDPRNTLFKEFSRFTKIIKPKVIIGENVKGLLSRKASSGQFYINIIIEEFRQLGYECIYKVFKCHEYGIPQKRERLIILGIRNDCLDEFNLEFPSPFNNVDISLKKIISFDMMGSIKVEDDEYDITKIPEQCILTDLDNNENEGVPHPYLKLKTKCKGGIYNSKTYDCLLSFSKRDSPIHSEIIDIRKPSKTIICTYNHQPRLLVPLRNQNGFFLRTLLVSELKQIQGFPSTFTILGTKKEMITQIGNAVPPPLITQIVNSFL
jgi:DNA (cytosine-5)-methyltransferase 1